MVLKVVNNGVLGSCSLARKKAYRVTGGQDQKTSIFAVKERRTVWDRSKLLERPYRQCLELLEATVSSYCAVISRTKSAAKITLPSALRSTPWHPLRSLYPAHNEEYPADFHAVRLRGRGILCRYVGVQPDYNADCCSTDQSCQRSQR